MVNCAHVAKGPRDSRARGAQRQARGDGHNARAPPEAGPLVERISDLYLGQPNVGSGVATAARRVRLTNCAIVRSSISATVLICSCRSWGMRIITCRVSVRAMTDLLGEVS